MSIRETEFKRVFARSLKEVIEGFEQAFAGKTTDYAQVLDVALYYPDGPFEINSEEELVLLSDCSEVMYETSMYLSDHEYIVRIFNTWSSKQLCYAGGLIVINY